MMAGFARPLLISLALASTTLASARKGELRPGGVDRFLSSAERAADRSATEARALRRALAHKPSLYDAAAAGALGGWLCGRIIIGDPRIMAIAGSSACVYAAHRQPDRRWGRCANRLTSEFKALRTRVAHAVSDRV